MLKNIFHLFFPRRCWMCGNTLRDDEKLLCLDCQVELPLTNYWLNPFDNPMARLFYGIVPLERCAAYCFFYPKSQTADIVYRFKYGNSSSGARELGRMIARELLPSGFFDGINAITFVPLTPKRLYDRCYNQSELIAEGIAQVLNAEAGCNNNNAGGQRKENFRRVPVLRTVLSRSTFTTPQALKSVVERRANVEHAFHLVDVSSLISCASSGICDVSDGTVGPDDMHDATREIHVLLVDDVVTTGSTTQACVKELIKVDGVKVSLLSFGFAGKMKV